MKRIYKWRWRWLLWCWRWWNYEHSEEISSSGQDADDRKQEKLETSPRIEDNGDVNISGSSGDGQER